MFAIGDRVTFTHNDLDEQFNAYVGMTAEVTGAWDLEEVHRLFPYSIRFDDGAEFGAFETELASIQK